MAERIVVGNPSAPLFTFDNADLIDCSCVLTSSLSGDELAIDQFMPVIYSASYIRIGFVPYGSTGLITADNAKFFVFPGTGFIDKIPYGTEIRYYNNENLIGKFYLQRVIRSGKAKFDLLAVSAVGVLDGQQHNGGIYTGQTFQTVASDIIDNEFSFTCSADVAGINIYGWLPIGTKRANLHQLLFATGVGLYKDINGEMVFRFPDTTTIKNVSDNRIFYGGQVNYQTPATKAEITEHIFEALGGDEQVTLYDNTQGELADHAFISFRDAPIHDLSASGLTIHESGVNYAVVSGVGTLIGKKYTHITRVLSDTVSDTNSAEKTVSVTDATLVNVANSENVLKRILSYYSSARTIRNDIVLADELPGDQIAFNNPYNEPEQAFLNTLEINASSFLRAQTEMITGYFPSGGGNNYTRSIVLTGSGTWVSPITGKIRVAIIGGGQGGHGGYAGGNADGYSGYWVVQSDTYGTKNITITHILPDGTTEKTNVNHLRPVNSFNIPGGENPGLGGESGEAGKGGKILVFAMNVVAGQQIAFSCGEGGEGGIGEHINDDRTIVPAEDGEEGTATTFGSYSSDSGFVQDYGYLDIISGNLYGNIGDVGRVGSAGSLGGRNGNIPAYTAPHTDEIQHSVTIQNGGGINGSIGGYGKWRRPAAGDSAKRVAVSGAGQGGAAFGSSGRPGMETNFVEGIVTSQNLETTCNGTRGADALADADCTIIGRGGDGGNGGGGGGCAGDAWTEFGGIYYGYNVSRQGGFGGDGSRGQRGGFGGIIINM